MFLAVVLHHEAAAKNEIFINTLLSLTNYAIPAYGVLHNEKRERNEGALHETYPEMSNNTHLGFVYAK